MSSMDANDHTISASEELLNVARKKMFYFAFTATVVVMTIILFFFHFNQLTILFQMCLILYLIFIAGVGQLIRANNFTAGPHLAIGICFVGITFNNISSGMLHSPFLVWIILIPIAAVFFTNKRGLYFWISATIAALAMTFVFHLKKVDIPWRINFDAADMAYFEVFSTFVAIFAAGVWFYVIRKAIVQSFQEVENAKEQISTLIRILGNDIFAPLSSIQSNLTLLASGQSGKDKIVRTAMQIQANTEHLNNLISKVRDINAIESGETELKLTEINICTCIEAVLAQMQERLELKNIQVLFQKSGENLNAKINDEYFQKVLFNILDNAIKFSEPDSNIQIDLLASANDLRLFIKDTGIGIPALILKDIYSYDASRIRAGTHQERGEGLGLPLVLRLLSKMNASIEISSNAIEETATNNGTTILITLSR